MSERYAGRFGLIDDEQLRYAAKYDSADDIDVRRMADELIARRAADLSTEDRRTLAWTIHEIRSLHWPRETSERARADAALALLTRLLASGDAPPEEKSRGESK